MTCTSCKKPISEHVAGRDLDRCVIEKWLTVELGRAPDIDKTGMSLVPHYSTLIQDAWVLVEKFSHLYVIKNGHSGSIEMWTVTDSVFRHTPLNIKAPTAPHAISLAFIAKGE